MKIAFLTFAFLGLFSAPLVTAQQLDMSTPKWATLQARRQSQGQDNYINATFSFRVGGNGEQALAATHNNWDLLFGNTPDQDTFDVTMVRDDCSRIKDLGEHSWLEKVVLPELPAYATPTREPSVKAIVNHLYLVHTKDRDEDHYAVFRVESLEAGKNVTISWKLLPPSQAKTK